MYTFLPLHVWDRELDSRLLLATLEASKGRTVILGHEYNISQLYGITERSKLFRAGQPLDHKIRGEWHKLVHSRSGYVITQDEEGVNNMPLIYRNIGDKREAVLDLQKIKNDPHYSSVEAFTNVDLQLAWGELHRIKQCHAITDIEARSIAINKIDSCSPIRFDLLGIFGERMNKRYVNSIQSLHSDYILILDNFSVDARGITGYIDPTNDLRQQGFSDKEILETIENQKTMREGEIASRKDFAKIVVEMAERMPQVNFVFRPHPVLCHKYWYERFNNISNITIAEKGPIHAWIYGSIATVHSGCTTGLEAYGANRLTIDISDLISERSEQIRASLVGQTKSKVSSVKELYKLLNSEIQLAKKGPRKNEDCIDISNYEQGGIDEALELMKLNSNIVSKRINESIQIDNSFEIIGNKSAICKVVENGNKESIADKDTVEHAKYILKYKPNRNKSRYCSLKEVTNRTRDILSAFKDFDITLPSIKITQIGINSFEIKQS